MSGQDPNQQERGLFSNLYNKVAGVSTQSTTFDGNYGNNNNQNHNNNNQGYPQQNQNNYNNNNQGYPQQNQNNHNNNNQGYPQQNQNQGYPQGQNNYNQNHGPYNPSAGANPPAGQPQPQFPGTCVPPPSHQGGGNCVNYNSIIALKHNNTGRFLSSTNQNYNSGSNQQQIYCNQWNVSNNERWEVLPSFQGGGNGPVQYNQRIRLRHCATGRQLHSHGNINSPVSQYQEVSGYGNQNQSDNNDDWILEKFSYNGNKEGGNWNVNDAFCLKHANTGLYLFSHDRNFNSGTEVACYGNGNDENNKWRLQLA